MNGPGGTGTPRSPTLLRTLDGAVLTDRRGDVELLQESRGAVLEWGGVYGQHVRLTGPWRLGVAVGDQSWNLPSTRTSIAVEGELLRSSHQLGPMVLEQQLAPLSGPPGAVRAVRLLTSGSERLPVVLTSTLEPFLLPVLVEGIRPVDFRLESRTNEVRIRHRGFGLSYRSSHPPARLYADRASWRGGSRRGPLSEFGSDHEILLEPGLPQVVRFSVTGGLERDLDRSSSAVALPPDPVPVARAQEELEGRWLSSTPQMRLPDDPGLERAYERARAGLRRLYSQPSDDLTGLVAGYPWYSAIWCRDLAWMLPAVIWLGDHSWARTTLDSVFRFQATREIGLLAAEPGELPMQISPGPVFLFGTSDTTLYYPELVVRWCRHAGVPPPSPTWGPGVARAIGWGERRTDPATGLLRNGGEVAELERASQSVAKVRYGIDAADTTIWDSTDRRDHAIDIQVLWRAALLSAATLAGADGDTAEAARLRSLAERLGETVASRYSWPEEGYLADSIRAGVPVRQLRPNALRAVSAGLLDPERARAAFRRAMRDDLTTAWGVRTLSSRDRGYDPAAYHDGQVWTIATAWAADAAWAVGDVAGGLAYLRTIAARYEAEDGGAHECYRGDRPEPYDSCFLLGFSVAPFLTVLFERLWGLSVDGFVPRLAIEPGFPSGWRTASLTGLRVGPGTADLAFEEGAVAVRWRGPRPLEVVGRHARCVVDPGRSAKIPVA